MTLSSFDKASRIPKKLLFKKKICNKKAYRSGLE